MTTSNMTSPTTPLQNVATVVELGERVMWDLMTIADYHRERERVRGWRYEGLPLPSKWELGIDPRPRWSPTFTVNSITVWPTTS